MCDFVVGLIGVLCWAFTMYYAVAVLIETDKDMKSESRDDKWVFVKKYARKFIQNFSYYLP